MARISKGGSTGGRTPDFASADVIVQTTTRRDQRRPIGLPGHCPPGRRERVPGAQERGSRPGPPPHSLSALLRGYGSQKTVSRGRDWAISPGRVTCFFDGRPHPDAVRVAGWPWWSRGSTGCGLGEACSSNAATRRVIRAGAASSSFIRTKIRRLERARTSTARPPSLGRSSSLRTVARFGDSGMGTHGTTGAARCPARSGSPPSLRSTPGGGQRRDFGGSRGFLSLQMPKKAFCFQ
jgi:hypothetical protein